MVSICIPCHTMNGENIKMLTQLLESIRIQTYRDFEIIVSDQSDNHNEIKELCRQYYATCLDNREGTRASAANINHSIINSKGDIIKPMFLDDLFNYDDSLVIMVRELNEEPKSNWIACGCMHYTDDIKKTYRPHFPEIPQYRKTEKENMQSLALGENLIGNPSVIMYRRNENLFDNPLRMLTDTDLYYRLYLKWGLPKLIDSRLVLIRIHERSQQQLCSKDLIEKEKAYIRAKFDVLDIGRLD